MTTEQTVTTSTTDTRVDRGDTVLALAAGLTWTIAATLMGMQADTEPVGVHYDAANRALVVPLVLLVIWAWRTRRHARGPGTTLTVGFGLMLLGVVVEFWGALLAGEHPSATARRLGEDAYFWGSDPGFATFALGALTTIVGFVLLARSRRGTASRMVLIRTGRDRRRGPGDHGPVAGLAGRGSGGRHRLRGAPGAGDRAPAPLLTDQGSV